MIKVVLVRRPCRGAPRHPRHHLEATDIQVVGEAGSYADCASSCASTPDVLVLDLDMPGRAGGLEMLAALRDDPAPVRRWWCRCTPKTSTPSAACAAGAMGYLNKAGEPAEMVAAMRTVPRAASTSRPRWPRCWWTPEHPQGEELHASLSERELQTLQKIASGKKLSQIAEELMLSPKTVSVYRARVLEKLHLTNNAELTVYAIRFEALRADPLQTPLTMGLPKERIAPGARAPH
jgi:two-component system, NarL family, invasion response regulator UvrY